MNPIYKTVKIIDSGATGKYMRAERELNAISLRKAARLMKIDPSNLSKMERGKMRITEKHVRQFNKSLFGKDDICA